MAVTLPNGALVAIAASYGSSQATTVLTNANPGVATITSHGYTNGDIVEISSGWSRLTDKLVRVASSTSNTFALEGINTTSTSVYPAGSGLGTARKITAWTQLSQILESTSSGGEQQFTEYQFLEADAQRRIPTFKTPFGLQFLVADDPALAGYILAETANDDRLQRGVRITLPSGALIFYNAYVSLNKTPRMTVNQPLAVQVTLSLLNEPVRYAS